MQDERREVSAKVGKSSFPAWDDESLLLGSGWKVLIKDMRQWLSAVTATDPSGGMEMAVDYRAARSAVKLVLSGFRKSTISRDCSPRPPSV